MAIERREVLKLGVVNLGVEKAELPNGVTVDLAVIPALGGTVKPFALEADPSARFADAAGKRVGVWARVRVGPFAHRSEAVSKLHDLRARGATAFIPEGLD